MQLQALSEGVTQKVKFHLHFSLKLGFHTPNDLKVVCMFKKLLMRKQCMLLIGCMVWCVKLHHNFFGSQLQK